MTPPDNIYAIIAYGLAIIVCLIIIVKLDAGAE
jgi:hypothetical protein